MKYKALMLDLDGTTIPSDKHAVPSRRVTEAIFAASKLLSVCIATGRALNEVMHILDTLHLSAPCILNHGAQVYDPVSKRSLREVTLTPGQARATYDVFVSAGLPVYLFADPTHALYEGGIVDGPVYGLWSRGATDQESEILERGFADIPMITVNKVPSWGTGMSYEITHADATKQHGVLEVARILGVKTGEIIAVGDSYNDYPLLMACGMKVAMGNAVPELKAIADYIAPPVHEDGVAHVIETFVLS